MPEEEAKKLAVALAPTVHDLSQAGVLPPMPAPEPPVLAEWANQVLEAFRQIYKVLADVARRVFDAIKSVWGSIWRVYCRAHAPGDKRSAWKLQHQFRARKRSTKRAHIYQLKKAVMHA